MPYHDLNLPSSTDVRTINHTLAFAAELGYNVLAISTEIVDKVPPTLPKVDLEPLQAANPGLRLLTRLTLRIADTSQNARVNTLTRAYDIVALRPMNDKSLAQICTTLDCDLISLDLSVRLPFLLKFKTVSSALQRGIRFEIAYSPGISGSSDAKRNLIAGATSLIRATRGRGIILSSEARNALGLRAPHDVMNLAQVWGLEQARGREGVCEEAAKVVRLAELRRNSYRGAIIIVDPGKPTVDAAKPVVQSQDNVMATPATSINGVKRKASASFSQPANLASQPNTAGGQSANAQPHPGKQPSKRELKRQAKKARLEGRGPGAGDVAAQQTSQVQSQAGALPMQHETFGNHPRKQAK
jgi:ribonuclease P/MRP protein subunit RPP1